MLITISWAVCPTTGNINNFLAGTTALTSDSVSFQVNANQSVASQTYNYQFQSTFANAPTVAIGTFSLTQPFKALHSTRSVPTHSQSRPTLSLPLMLNFFSSTPKAFGQASRSISGSVPTLKSKLDRSMQAAQCSCPMALVKTASMFTLIYHEPLEPLKIQSLECFSMVGI